MGCASIFDRLEELYEDRARAAREWKGRGGRVVGYVCDNVPVELILAAGCLPYRVNGGPDADLSPVREKIDLHYTPDLTGRPDFVGAMLSQLLTGKLDFLDMLVIPHNRHAVQAMYRELQEVVPDDGVRLPRLHYLDKAWSPYFGADSYNRAAVLGLAEALADLTGSPLSPRDIAEASAQVQRARDVLAQLTDARLARPARLTGTVALHAYAAFTVLPPDEFTEVAVELLERVGQLPKRNGPRLFVGGSPFDHDRFYRLVERSGATIVAEDHCWGARTCDRLAVAHGADPLERIAERYHLTPACSIRFPLASSRVATVGRALAARADAAIFVTFERDAVQAWETPGEVAQLRASGMKVLHLSEQVYACDGDGVAEEVDAFLASLDGVTAS